METNNCHKDNSTHAQIKELIKNTAIDAADIEKTGALLLSIGYATFIDGANIDILEALEINNSGITSFNILVFGQTLTVIGYIYMYIATTKRLEEKTLGNLHENKNHNLKPFQIIQNAYLGSIIVNYLRLVEFQILLNEEQNN